MAEQRVQRRLAAILVADVVGYSRLMEADEALTRARLTSLYAELIDPQIAAAAGRIVKTMGDGILVEFASVVDAVHCALNVQNFMRLRNAGIPETLRMELRVGVNLGDVIIEGDDIHGDGVNVAARLEGLCEPGAVFVSGAVHDQAVGKLTASFEDLGEQTVKNIARPVRVYRVSGEVAADAAPAAQAADAPSAARDRPSVAVLPFENMSGDPEQEYFSDGMAEDLITDISQISGVFVTARNSSFAFKGQARDIKEIARTLGVRHVVEGSVRKMGSKLRINTQLIDAVSGGHLWAARYDGDLADIFAFQDDIREQIVAALRVTLSPADKTVVKRKATDSVEAYDLFLRGRQASYRRDTPDFLLEAIKCLEQAVAIDPNFADAYGYLSYCHFFGWVALFPGFDDTLSRANELAERALAFDGSCAIAIITLGWIQTWSRDYDRAIANFERAIALFPDSAEVYANFGNVLNYCGDPGRGLRMQERALGLEKFPPLLWETLYAGISHFLLGHYDVALASFSRLAAQTPKFVYPHAYSACAYVELGRTDDARAAIARVLEISPQITLAQFERRLPYRIEAVHDRIFDSLRQAGLPEG